MFFSHKSSFIQPNLSQALRTCSSDIYLTYLDRWNKPDNVRSSSTNFVFSYEKKTIHFSVMSEKKKRRKRRCILTSKDMKRHTYIFTSMHNPLLQWIGEEENREKTSSKKQMFHWRYPMSSIFDYNRRLPSVDWKTVG